MVVPILYLQTLYIHIHVCVYNVHVHVHAGLSSLLVVRVCTMPVSVVRKPFIEALVCVVITTSHMSRKWRALALLKGVHCCW